MLEHPRADEVLEHPVAVVCDPVAVRKRDTNSLFGANKLVHRVRRALLYTTASYISSPEAILMLVDVRRCIVMLFRARDASESVRAAYSCIFSLPLHNVAAYSEFRSVRKSW